MTRPSKGKACVVWILGLLWTYLPAAATTLARWLTAAWPGFKER